jgi:DNA-binding NarL/FixJ family response regulator
MPIKILLADDSRIMRKAIKSFLDNQPEILIVGEAETFDEAIAKSQELRPDVIVLDVHLTEGCIEFTQWKSALDGTKVLAITLGVDDTETRELAKGMKADKLVDKMNLSDELIPAILELSAEPRPS